MARLHQDNYGHSFVEISNRNSGYVPGLRVEPGVSLPPLARAIFDIGRKTRVALFDWLGDWLRPTNPSAGGLSYERHSVETAGDLQRVTLKITDSSIALQPSLGPSIVDRLQWGLIDVGLSKPGDASFVGWVANTGDERPERVCKRSQEGDPDLRLAVGRLAYRPLTKLAAEGELRPLVLHGVYQEGARAHLINSQREERLNIFDPNLSAVAVNQSDVQVRADTVPVHVSIANGIHRFTVELATSRSMLEEASSAENLDASLVERLREMLRLENPKGVFQREVDARESRGYGTDMLLIAHDRAVDAIERLFANDGDTPGVLRYGVEIGASKDSVPRLFTDFIEKD